MILGAQHRRPRALAVVSSALGHSRRFVMSAVCPVWPRQQTYPDPLGTSYLGQQQKSFFSVYLD